MILIRQSYRSGNALRQAELDRAAELNASAGLFAAVSEVDGSAGRLTYDDLFSHAARSFPGEICVVANSDISFDDSLRLAVPLVRENALVTLSRWESEAGPVMGGHVADEDHGKLFSQSQDTWIFVAGGLPRFRTDFQLGILTCETRLAYEAAAAGVTVLNPALSVRSWHHHASNDRTYRLGDSYEGPRYLPRLTTAEGAIAEGYVIDRTRRPKGRIVRLAGSATAFAGQTANRPFLDAAEPLPRQLRRLKIGLRSPVFIRRRCG